MRTTVDPRCAEVPKIFHTNHFSVGQISKRNLLSQGSDFFFFSDFVPDAQTVHRFVGGLHNAYVRWHHS